MIDDKRPKASFHHLKPISVIGGFLDGQSFELTDRMNRIIDARNRQDHRLREREVQVNAASAPRGTACSLITR